MFIHAVPYADIVLTDREFRDYLLRADRNLETKVFGEPNEAARCLREVTQRQ